MNQIIQRFCDNGQSNGLLLLDMPTGSGKTYSVLKYIFDAVQDPDNNQKYFFITTLKKNLPIDDIQDRFEKAGQLPAFREKFLFVDSNSESAINNFSKALKEIIPFEVRKTEEFKAFEQYITAIISLRQRKDTESKSILRASEDKFRTEVEPKFRRMVQNLLARKYRTWKDRLYAIKTDPDWQWLGELYPIVFMKERQIIFMSMDKFLSHNSTIIEPTCMLYNSDMIQDAVIFIDEFDATKETVLKNIIQNGLREKIDYVELFKSIYAALHTHSFPASLTTPSRVRQEGPYRDQSLQSVIDGMIEKADEIHRVYSLQFSHKTEDITDEDARNFLFQDHQYHSILNGNKSYVVVTRDTEQRINAIRFEDERPSNNQTNIQIMLGKLRGFVSFFMIGINILAVNYQQCKEEHRNPADEDFPREAAIKTVLAEFGLENTYIDYLTSQILMSSHKARGNIQESGFDLSFYEKGFRYYAFEDDRLHDTQSKIMMYSFQTTPEKILLRFCEKAKVLGISATATIPTVIGNYDLDYLREKLQDRSTVITDEERARLKDSFEYSMRGYDKVRIHTELIGTERYHLEAWKQVVDGDESAEFLYELVERELSEDNNDYNKERYLRIAIAFKNFLVKSDIRSFLCVLTKHPRKGDRQLNVDVLMQIISLLCKKYALQLDPRKCVVQLDGEEYDSKKDEIITRLSKGEKLFVISVYQTLGAGQNLQYPAPADLLPNLVKVNEERPGSMKDFDAIYLDKPTNLLVQLGINLEDENFVKYIYHIEMLQEAAELSADNTLQCVKKAFDCLHKPVPSSKYAPYIYNLRSVILLSTRVIIQAIGRMCRTNLKSPDVYIFADNRISECLDTSIIRDRMFNREFLELVHCLNAQNVQIPDAFLSDKASLTSVRVNKYIMSMLREDWTDDRIERWKRLREMVLKAPTLARDDFDRDGIAYNFYMEVPEKAGQVFYTESEDYNKIRIFFDRRPAGGKVVSADAAKLPMLMKTDSLRRYFEKHGWATSFEPNDYILCPPLFNNIYRGAIGEVVGKALFYQYANVELEDISDNSLFELFDYKVPDTAVYVDFKNWHESSRFDDEEMTTKIIGKAKECAAKCVIIANIVGSSAYEIRKKTIDGIEVLILPALLVENDDQTAPTPNVETFEQIRRCIREHRNCE